LEFIKKKEQREEEHKAQRAELEAAKEKIYLKLKEEQEKRRKEIEELENLRYEL